MTKAGPWVTGVLLVALCGAALTHGRLWQLPEPHNPWAPLSLAHPPNWLTRHKLDRLDADRAACLAVLAQSPFRFEAVPDRATGPGCGFDNAVRVRRMQAALGSPVVLSCRAAVSLALWERHALQPAAMARFGRPVGKVEHFGTYACRNVYGRTEGRRSQHATADAFDLAGVVLVGGRRVSVAAHWDGDAPEAGFLRDVHAGACRFFDGVLGPEYNAAHADHLHLDRGPHRVCR